MSAFFSNCTPCQYMYVVMNLMSPDDVGAGLDDGSTTTRSLSDNGMHDDDDDGDDDNGMHDDDDVDDDDDASSANSTDGKEKDEAEEDDDKDDDEEEQNEEEEVEEDEVDAHIVQSLELSEFMCPGCGIAALEPLKLPFFLKTNQVKQKPFTSHCPECNVDYTSDCLLDKCSKIACMVNFSEELLFVFLLTPFDMFFLDKGVTSPGSNFSFKAFFFLEVDLVFTGDTMIAVTSPSLISDGFFFGESFFGAFLVRTSFFCLVICLLVCCAFVAGAFSDPAAIISFFFPMLLIV
jgi:hypothetical protein